VIIINKCTFLLLLLLLKLILFEGILRQMQLVIIAAIIMIIWDQEALILWVWKVLISTLRKETKNKENLSIAYITQVHLISLFDLQLSLIYKKNGNGKNLSHLDLHIRKAKRNPSCRIRSLHHSKLLICLKGSKIVIIVK